MRQVFLALSVVASLLLAPCSGSPESEVPRSNLFLRYETGEPAAGVKVWNDTGVALISDGDGVLFAPPAHWSREGTVLKTNSGGKLSLVTVGPNGVVLLPKPEHGLRSLSDWLLEHAAVILGVAVGFILYIVVEKLANDALNKPKSPK